MIQPVSGCQYKVISGGVGTGVLTDISCVFHAVHSPGTYVGTLKIHDASTAAGTTTTSNFMTISNPPNANYQYSILDLQCKKGLVYEATGTPLATLMWY